MSSIHVCSWMGQPPTHAADGPTEAQEAGASNCRMASLSFAPPFVAVQFYLVPIEQCPLPVPPTRTRPIHLTRPTHQTRPTHPTCVSIMQPRAPLGQARHDDGDPGVGVACT